jgi:hypothetical protein
MADHGGCGRAWPFGRVDAMGQKSPQELQKMIEQLQRYVLKLEKKIKQVEAIAVAAYNRTAARR